MPTDNSAIEDFLHDVLKINSQLKKCLSEFQINDTTPSNIKRVWAQANLLSVCIRKYEFNNGIRRANNGELYDIPIYKRAEKIYKCLDNQHFEKKVTIRLNSKNRGQIHLIYKTSDIIELAFYIIFENAIKYALWNSTINIDFTEKKHGMLVMQCINSTTNPGSDLERLFERGVRGDNSAGVEGDGIGLHLLREICCDCGVGLKIDAERTRQKTNNQPIYKFYVSLTFNNCKQER